MKHDPKLTAKQEAFAFSIGYENKTYTEAYKEHYEVKPETKETSIWRSASAIANKPKIKARISELKNERQKEIKLSFCWTIEEAETNLRMILEKNKNDLLKAELEGKPAREANNKAILGAVQILNDMLKEITFDDAEDTQGNRNVIIELKI